MPKGYQPQVELPTANYKGTNNALQFSQLSPEQSVRLKNAYMGKVGSISKRPGSIPVSNTSLGATIQHLTVYDGVVGGAAGDIYGSSGATLYKYASAAWIAQTMTAALNSSQIYTVGFKNISGVTRMIIADGGSLKQLNSATNTVTAITPAANKADPVPPNILADVNALGIDFVWVHKGRIFVSDGSDTYWYFSLAEFDYIPQTQVEQLVRNNDYINGCGMSYNDVLLVPMRMGWNITRGNLVDNIDSSEFLNTTTGVIAPRSIARITYPNGGQTIPFLSDDGVHEVYNIADETGGANQYSTRSLMKDKIDFEAIGLTESEKADARGYFDARLNLYLLSFNQGSTRITYAYDVRNGEWYTDWMGFNAQSYVSKDAQLYFAGNTGHLHKFDKDLYSDWNDSAKTTGSPVQFERYSPLLSLEFSGYASYWDYYLMEAKQFLVPATVNLQIIFGNTAATTTSASPWKLNVAVYGVSRYGQARYANLQYTDIVNAPERLKFRGKKAKYVQMLWYNYEDQPVEVYKDKWIGRTSGA
jgi:hypothetical protein